MLLQEPDVVISGSKFKCPDSSLVTPCKCFTWDETDQLFRKAITSKTTTRGTTTTTTTETSGTESSASLAPVTKDRESQDRLNGSNSRARVSPLAVDHQVQMKTLLVTSVTKEITTNQPLNSNASLPSDATSVSSSDFETEVEISCRTSATDELSLQALFSRLDEYIRTEDALRRFTSLRLENTNIGIMDGNDWFHGISFRSLDFFQNIDLDTFDLRSFSQSHDTLESLLLSGSPFKGGVEFFRELSRFKKLETLILSHNQIEGLPEGVFGQSSSLPQLSYLDLQGNRIKHLGRNAFHGLPSIQRITLDNNFITNITNETFLFNEEKSKLLLIFLRNNNLTAESFEPFSFTNTEKTIFLYLNGNQISHLREDIFKPMLDLKNDLFIALWSNPFSCDCRSKWLMQEKSYYKKRLHGIKCLDKKEIWDLEEEELRC